MESIKHKNLSVFRVSSILSKEKGIDEKLILKLLIDSIEASLSLETNLNIKIILDEGIFTIYVVRQIVSQPTSLNQISLKTIWANAHNKIYKNITVDNMSQINDGDFIYEALEVLSEENFGNLSRSTVNSINKIFKSKIVEVEKDKEFNIFKDKKGLLVSGVVSRIEHGNIIVNLEVGEGFLSKYELVPGEVFSYGASIQALIYDVQRDTVKYQILLTRSRPDFLLELMKIYIPEIESGFIEIKGIVRDGDRAKVAVYSDYVDPVATCIGKGGDRIKNIRALLNERIDIVRWDSDLVKFISASIHPIEVLKFVFHSETEVELVLDSENINKARSHRRQQIKLASRLTKCKISIIPKQQHEENIREEYDNALKLFSQIGLNELQIRLLVGDNVACLEDLMEAPKAELMQILSENELYIEELQAKAKVMYLDNLKNQYTLYNIDLSLLELDNVCKIEPSILYEYKVYDIIGLSNLDSDEVYDILNRSCVDMANDNLYKLAEQIVIAARSKRGILDNK